MAPKTILQKCAEAQKLCKSPLVVITGGEPLIQSAVVPLIDGLVLNGYQVQIETAGTVWPHGLEDVMRAGVDIVCSPKTGKVHPMIEAYTYHWKYIISTGISATDGLPDTSTQHQNRATSIYRNRHGVVWVQPCDEHDARLNQLNIDRTAHVAMKHGYTVSIQLHKILGVE